MKVLLNHFVLHFIFVTKVTNLCFMSDLIFPFACYSCGAMTHNAKSCMERPRKKGAKWTNMHIAPDEKIETFELDYDGKRD